MAAKASKYTYNPPKAKGGAVELPSPAEVVIRLSLAEGKIISITDEKGVPFEDELLTETLIQEFGMHVENMPHIAEIRSIKCDKKPSGCITITFPDGTTSVRW